MVRTANTTSFIKIDRNILRWRWYGEKNTLAVFIHILLKANFADGYYSGSRIHRGQYAFSQRTLARDVGMTHSEVRTALEHLVETGEISVEAFPRYTVVTVLNYDKYQTKPPEKPKQKPKTKKAKESEAVNKVPKEYQEFFGDDYEAYERWAKQ